jgi:SpoVK/Ycf46/Vps4 family AAA+-type ATPase
MDPTPINNLREALKHSPDNQYLRLILAEALLESKKHAEAEQEFKIILAKEGANIKAKSGLAKAFYAQKKFSTAIVILEEILYEQPGDGISRILLTKSLVGNNELQKAIENYRIALDADPSCADPELDEQLRSTSSHASDSIESIIESLEGSFDTLEKPKINFDDVGGMANVKDEIRIKIIQPLEHPDLYQKFGKKTGGGILFYGPPGCGKTHLARATAGQINAGFISIGIHDVLDMWIGNSEKKLHDVFELARRQKPCVLFFDEIDALGASRSDMRHSGAKMLINQFLTELDGVQSSNDGILVLGATNAPWHLDPAFRRPGRFDRIIFISPPDQAGRESILKILLKDKPIGSIDYTTIAKQTTEFSGADLMALTDLAVEEKLRESFDKGEAQPIQNKDLLNALKKVKPSTKEWFNTARNYALYANDSGLYDEILDYLKIKK